MACVEYFQQWLLAKGFLHEQQQQRENSIFIFCPSKLRSRWLYRFGSYEKRRLRPLESHTQSIWLMISKWKKNHEGRWIHSFFRFSGLIISNFISLSMSLPKRNGCFNLGRIYKLKICNVIIISTVSLFVCIHGFVFVLNWQCPDYLSE